MLATSLAALDPHETSVENLRFKALNCRQTQKMPSEIGCPDHSADIVVTSKLRQSEKICSPRTLGLRNFDVITISIKCFKVYRIELLYVMRQRSSLLDTLCL
ncbi:hypothetical protein EVAR_78493_1 [Eumeta japonica]|uniref:Uncharacterized protein n=1 Tax=Eumeta variegata TaxID=151549 RepID=A0A4C1TYY2_EUMVA|nr:hypothetical protein EVAR_78493_1 [Eumeta japonica]